MPHVPYKEASRKNWGRDIEDTENESLDREDLRTGALLRIADSLEKMEEPYRRLIDDNQWLRESRRAKLARIEDLQNQNRALKSWITRLKKKMEKADA